jgi:hypothetical protein
VSSRREGRYKFHYLDTTLVERWSIEDRGEAEAVRINLASVLVDDQDKALRFYRRFSDS